MSLPNLIIAGVNKAGTSSLFTYLNQHPEVCGSSRKETCYFLPVRYGTQMEDLSKYEKYFEKCTSDKKVILEATPGYFYGGLELATKIKNELGNVKIIIVLRDPVARALSFYNHLSGKALIDKKITFGDCIEKGINKYVKGSKYIQGTEYEQRIVFEGLYIEFLEDWFTVFGSENIKILFFEDLKNNTKNEMLTVCSWLNIPSQFYENYEFKVENVTMQYKNKGLHLLMLKLYLKFEIFFRKNNKIKNIIRDFYYSFNATKPKNNLNSNVFLDLEKYYSKSNSELKNLLQLHGYSSFPDWLKN